MTFYAYAVRPAEAGVDGPWVRGKTVRTVKDLKDELASWSGPHLFHGDILAVSSDKASVHSTYVFDSVAGAFVLAPKPPSDASDWFNFWENDNARKNGRILAASKADPRRLALSAIHCGWLALKPSGKVDPALSAVLKASEKLVAGDGTIAEVQATLDGGKFGSNLTISRQGVASAGMAAILASVATSSRASPQDRDAAASRLPSVANSAITAFTLVREGDFGDRIEAEGAMQSIVRRFLPLSVVLCSRLGLREPVALPSQ